MLRQDIDRCNDATTCRRLGSTGPTVSPIGLRVTGGSRRGPAAGSPPSGRGHETEAVATVRAAVDAGVTLLDTGDLHGTGHNELLLRAALRGRPRDRVQISVAFGVLRDPSGGFLDVDTRPVAVKDSLTHTLCRLGTDYIDIYRPAQFSPDVPVEDTVGAVADLVTAGYVRYLGLRDVGPATLRAAAAVHPVSDVQVTYPRVAGHGEDATLQAARELGIGLTVYGMPSLGAAPSPGVHDHLRSPAIPHGAPELWTALQRVSADTGASVMQIALAWVLTRGVDIVPLAVTGDRNRLDDALGALRLRIPAADLARIDAAAGQNARSHAVGATAAGTAAIVGRPPARARSQPPPGSGPAGPRNRPDTPALSHRETEVLDLVVAGLTNRAIGTRLGISERTAREHVARIMLKLRVESRVEAAVIATEWRLTRSRLARPEGGAA